jgi:YggT family protein
MRDNPNHKDNIDRRQDLRDDEESYLLHQDERRLNLARRMTLLSWIIQSIYWFVGILELLLGVKFLLRLSGANTENQFAQLIYNLCAPFLSPFSTLFISPTSPSGSSIFDLNILIAIIVYAILSYLLVSFVVFIFRHEA